MLARAWRQPDYDRKVAESDRLLCHHLVIQAKFDIGFEIVPIDLWNHTAEDEQLLAGGLE
jgi:hypothetical protein